MLELCKATAENPKVSFSDVEIAFFGGSFTAIDKDYMISLLEAGHKAVKKYGFKGIRISTRPDCIDEEILKLIKAYGVTSIELGAQSMVDKVLCKNDRGHTAEDVKKASKLIKEFGFELGLQMMTGLYASSDENDKFTAREIIALKPSTVRIYPTVVLKDTKLHRLIESGEYKAQTVESAVKLCAKLIKMFDDENIKVIRLGLHASEILEKDYVDGAYHPAFMELCKSELNFEKILDDLKRNKLTSAEIYVNPKLISQFLGQKKINLKKFKDLGYDVKISQKNGIDDYILKERI